MHTALLFAALISQASAQEPLFTENLELTGEEPNWGDPAAKYTVVQYSDWQCPHCARAYDDLHKLTDEQPDIRVLFKVYPLTTHCNPAVSTDLGFERCTLAQAAACAEVQGRWGSFADWAFGDQNAVAGATPESLIAGAKDIGLKKGAFKKCLEAELGGGQVLQDAVEGGRLGLMGTPTLLVGGLPQGGWIQSLNGVEGVVEMVAEAREME